MSYKYEGKWVYEYNTSYVSHTDVATLIANYDSTSGILLGLEIDMVSIQVTLGPLSEEIAVDSVGSFKIKLILPSNHETNASSLGFAVSTVFLTVILLRKYRREHL